MESEILLMNARFWANLELSTLRPGLRRTVREIPYLKKGIRKKKNYAIIDNMVDELHMIESKKLSSVNHEAPKLLESDYDANDLYQVGNVTLDESKEKMEWCKRAFGY